MSLAVPDPASTEISGILLFRYRGAAGSQQTTEAVAAGRRGMVKAVYRREHKAMKWMTGRWVKNRNKSAGSLQSREEYEKIKSKLYVQLIGIERNEDLLSHGVYTQIEDMALVYGMQAEVWERGYMGYLFTDDLMKKFGITKMQLHQDAMANVVQMWPVTFRRMEDVVEELSEQNLLHPNPSGAKLYIVSNQLNMTGAAALFYPKMMERISQEIGGDYYILPSSVHEMIVLPDDDMLDPAQLQQMVQVVNSELDEEDVLTDQIYHYDAEQRAFELASVYAWRKENEQRFWEKMALAQ